MKKLLILLLFLFPSTVLAAPSVSSISGTIANNSAAGSGPSRLIANDGLGTDILQTVINGSYTVR